MVDFAIHTQNLIKDYGKFRALDDVSITVAKGEFVSLLGPNGAGKTSFLEVCEGIREATSGIVQILGKTWKNSEDELRRRIGLSFQDTRFQDRVTVWETLELFGAFFGLPKARILEVMVEVQLSEKQDTYVMNLSGGQRQRLAIATAILHKPELLFLDEPTTGLDPTSRREIWSLLQKLKSQGMTMILTTHYMDEAEALCERIIFMHKGKVYKDGKLKDLVKEAGKQSLEELFLSLTGSALETQN